MSDPQDIWRELDQLYAAVDRRTAELAEHHRSRLQCRLGCTDCCVDNVSVFEVEADRIKHRNAHLLTNEQPHPTGACAFLGESGDCRIYNDRPYVCRTQGLPLAWVEELPDGPTMELRDICPLNDTEPPLESISIDYCWRIGPIEGQLAQLQSQNNGGQLRRVRLRDLFLSRSLKREVETQWAPHPSPLPEERG